MPMLPRVPHLAKADDAKPIMRAVRATAAEYGLSEFLVAKVMSRFLQAAAEEVAAGRVFRIPAFGIFAARPVGKRGRPAPCFVASRCWNNEVEATCSPEAAARGKKAIRAAYHSHHPSTRSGKHQRVMTGQVAFRDQLDADARKMGLA